MVIISVVLCVVLRRDKSFGGPYKREAVATDTQQCSDIGENILNANGSAVDAAIAAMFCLGVVNIVYNQTLKKATVIDFRETAPATAYRDMFKGKEEEAKKGLYFYFCMILLWIHIYKNSP